MTGTNLSGQLDELFREIGEAHHQAYIETDGFDPEWPLWYADYLRDRIGPLLGAEFTESEPVYLLIWVANANWARFFAERYAG